MGHDQFMYLVTGYKLTVFLLFFFILQSKVEHLRSTVSQGQSEKERLEQECGKLQQKLKSLHQVDTGGGIESVECSTGMEWWNGMVEWTF